jgi:hypothetical protein
MNDSPVMGFIEEELNAREEFFPLRAKRVIVSEIP